MRKPSPKAIALGAVLALGAVGVADAATARLHTIKVDAPDGQVVEVRYAGDVAPQVQFVPGVAMDPADARGQAQAQADAMDPFAQMDAISAMMDAQMSAMMQRAAMVRQQQAQAWQQAVARGDVHEIAPGVTMVGGMPKDAHFSYVSTTTDANGCTRQVSYTSDGSGAAPQVTKAASDGCDAVRPRSEAIQAKAEVPAAQAAAPSTRT